MNKDYKNTNCRKDNTILNYVTANSKDLGNTSSTHFDSWNTMYNKTAKKTYLGVLL